MWKCSRIDLFSQQQSLDCHGPGESNCGLRWKRYWGYVSYFYYYIISLFSRLPLCFHCSISVPAQWTCSIALNDYLLLQDSLNMVDRHIGITSLYLENQIFSFFLIFFRTESKNNKHFLAQVKRDWLIDHWSLTGQSVYRSWSETPVFTDQ